MKFNQDSVTERLSMNEK